MEAEAGHADVLSPTESYEIRPLLKSVEEVCSPDVSSADKRQTLERLSIALRPHHLSTEARGLFVRRALDLGVVDSAVRLVECGGSYLAAAASNFLGDFAFNSDLGACAVLAVFDRLADRFRLIFSQVTNESLHLLEAAILLCVNIAATCPSGHPRLIPLVRPVCLQIIRDPRVSNELRGNTILLLANLSTTVSQELRELGVADALLELILKDQACGLSKSVAESVVIFLHGDRKCPEVDRLMAVDVIGEYCVPIMELTLLGEEFRGMYPHLLYSARLFALLSRSREYAEALAANSRVVPLLLRASRCKERPPRIGSDLEGRQLALEALGSLAGFGLWRPPLPDRPALLLGSRAPPCRAPLRSTSPGDSTSSTSRPALPDIADDDWCEADFVADELPVLLEDDRAATRAAASRIWGCLYPHEVATAVLVGYRLEAQGLLTSVVWREKVLTFLFPAFSAL